MLSKTGFRYANYLVWGGGGGGGVKMLKERGERKHAAAGLASRRVTLSSCLVSESLMVSEGGEKKVSQRHALLQDEQMAESKCGDLFYISIPCCGAVDVGFRSPPTHHTILFVKCYLTG